jgi:hypothetical protein
MAAPRQKPGETARLLRDLPLDLGELPIRLTQADFARLCGCSRARVSQWVSAGTIPTKPGGKIDPSEAFAALLRHDRDTAKLRVLHNVRREIDEAEARAVAAEAVALKAAERLAAIEADLLALVEMALAESRLASALIDETAALAGDDDALEQAHDAAVDRAFERAITSPTEPLAGVNEELAALIARLCPAHAPAPPPSSAEAPAVASDASTGPDLFAAVDPDSTPPAAALAEGEGATA